MNHFCHVQPAGTAGGRQVREAVSGAAPVGSRSPITAVPHTAAIRAVAGRWAHRLLGTGQREYTRRQRLAPNAGGCVITRKELARHGRCLQLCGFLRLGRICDPSE